MAWAAVEHSQVEVEHLLSHGWVSVEKQVDCWASMGCSAFSYLLPSIPKRPLRNRFHMSQERSTKYFISGTASPAKNLLSRLVYRCSNLRIACLYPFSLGEHSSLFHSLHMSTVNCLMSARKNLTHTARFEKGRNGLISWTICDAAIRIVHAQRPCAHVHHEAMPPAANNAVKTSIANRMREVSRRY